MTVSFFGVISSKTPSFLSLIELCDLFTEVCDLTTRLDVNQCIGDALDCLDDLIGEIVFLLFIGT